MRYDIPKFRWWDIVVLAVLLPPVLIWDWLWNS